MSWTLIAETGAGGDANTSTTPDKDTAGADLIVGLCTWYTPNGPVTPVDSLGDTVTLGDQVNGSGGMSGRLFWIENPTPGTRHFSISGVTINPNIVWAAWSGKKSGTAFETQTGTGGSGSTIQPGSITPSEDGELVVCGGFAGNGSLVGVDAPLAMTASSPVSNGGGFMLAALAWQAQTTAAAVNANWTVAAGGYGNGACQAVFKAAPGGGASVPPFRTRSVARRMVW